MRFEWPSGTIRCRRVHCHFTTGAHTGILYNSEALPKVYVSQCCICDLLCVCMINSADRTYALSAHSLILDLGDRIRSYETYLLLVLSLRQIRIMLRVMPLSLGMVVWPVMTRTLLRRVFKWHTAMNGRWLETPQHHHPKDCLQWTTVLSPVSDSNISAIGAT